MTPWYRISTRETININCQYYVQAKTREKAIEKLQHAKGDYAELDKLLNKNQLHFSSYEVHDPWCGQIVKIGKVCRSDTQELIGKFRDAATALLRDMPPQEIQALFEHEVYPACEIMATKE